MERYGKILETLSVYNPLQYDTICTSRLSIIGCEPMVVPSVGDSGVRSEDTWDSSDQELFQIWVAGSLCFTSWVYGMGMGQTFSSFNHFLSGMFHDARLMQFEAKTRLGGWSFSKMTHELHFQLIFFRTLGFGQHNLVFWSISELIP